MESAIINILLILSFFSIVFIQSGLDKVFNKKENLSFLYELLGKVFSKSLILVAFYSITLLEVASGFLCLIGVLEIIVDGSSTLGYWGLIVGALALLILLFGQRMSQNYDGAKTITIYFILTVFGISLF
tara:strand:+ start:198 stop:584 length:387 start_codon:yes stop_codon:yes gene_type:complete